MDAAKLRAFAGIAGAVFGFAGVLFLTIALAIALSPVIGAAWAALASALVMIALAGAALFVSFRPKRSIDDDLNKIGDAAAEALADLPFDTLKEAIRQNPYAAIGLAAAAGVAVSRDPENAVRDIKRLAMSFL